MSISLMRLIMVIVAEFMHTTECILSFSSTLFLKNASDIVAFIILKIIHMNQY